MTSCVLCPVFGKKMPSRPVSVRYRAIVAFAYVALLGFTGCSAAPTAPSGGHLWDRGGSHRDGSRLVEPGRPGVGTEVEPK